MHREDLGFRVGTTAYHRKDGEKISLGFEHRLRQERADRIWVLRACDTPGEASYWEQYFSVSYGIPTWIFYADGRSVTFDNDRISKLYGVIDSEVGATRLLKDEHMFWNYPHHTPRSTSKDRRRTFTVTMMGDSRSGSHRYAVSGSDKADGALLTAAGFFVRSAKAGRGWRIEGQSKDLEAVYQLHDDIIQHLPLNFKEQAKFSCGRLPVTPASHVLPGMKLFVLQSGKVTLDEVISVDIEDQIVKVYDLEVEDLHHFAANGILTHNSMYAFRGAEPAVLRERFAAHWPTVRRFNLPVNYRSTQAIVKAAADLIGHNYDGQDDQYLKPFQWRPTAPNGVAVHYEALGDFDELAEQVAAIVAADPARWFVLSRTCAECAAIHMKLIERRIPAVNKSGGLLFGTPPVRKALAYARLACDYQGARDDMEILGEIANVATINFTAPFTRRNHRDGCTNTKGWVDCGCPIIMEEGKDYCHARYYGQKAIQAAGSWRGIVEQQYETNRGGYPTMQAKGARDLVEFVERLEALKGDAGACLRMIIADCILPWTAAEYGLQDADLAEDGAVESLDLILNLIEPGQTMEAYLQAVDEISAGDAGEDDEHSVLVGTIHWSKGLERPGVILNATRLPIVSPKPIPGKLPMGRPATIEEERRLAFVAVTRAKDEVVVVTSKEWNGQDLPGSQFVRELGL
jgi:DNA helicase-2/ATP-dependent DNA helicase PcrA